MITDYKEMLVRERMQERLAEAARERLARQARADPHVDGTLRARLAGAFVRRLTRIAEPF